jgi:hypothetical protein
MSYNVLVADRRPSLVWQLAGQEARVRWNSDPASETSPGMDTISIAQWPLRPTNQVEKEKETVGDRACGM